MLNTEIDKIKNDLIDQLNNVSIDILNKIPTEIYIDEIFKYPRTKKGFFLYSEEKFNKFMLEVCPKSFYLILKTGGRKPFFKMHTDSTDRHLMKEFNPDGLDDFFKRIEILMKRQTQVKGICGSSWFFDPALKEISPELSYIREISESYGASFFDLGSNKGIIKDAIFMSPKRIKLYKQGEYMPNAFLMLITRKDLLNNLK